MTSRSGSIGIALLVAHLVVVGGVVVVVVTAGAYSMKQFYSQQSAMRECFVLASKEIVPEVSYLRERIPLA